ncbi:hypothetical protein J8L88_17860 [Aquimarina sp. MMG015]|uniref:hypothetical protein n=1 Tax=Aquimarina TaxID=290174 RepID=UPI0005513FFE|nr:MULTISPECIES: hypothetical protein [Aquimarina]AXT54853.1 hypothetical protein D1815_03470 [Aquimarina sp. AD1]MBQ4804733.1 hypothetical protein [Aquimarina sp. MMG015]
MKRVINLCLIALVIITSSVANAAGRVSVEITNSSMVNVSLTEVIKGEKLFLKDYHGEVLFNVTLEATPSYQKYFNLGNVPDGVYFVETEAEYEIKVTPLLKNQKGVSLINTSAVTVFKPLVRAESKFIKVMFNNTEKSPVNLTIYDNEFRVLEEVIGNEEEVLKRTYDFSKMPKGEYQFYFALKDRTFIKKVSI